MSAEPVITEPLRALEFYCGIGPWPSSRLSYRQRIVQVGCTALSQGAASETRPLFARLIGINLLALFTQQTMVLASHTGYVLRFPRRAEFSPPDCLCSQLDIGTLDADALQPLNANLWLMSPACQPYTVLNPNAKGAADPRAQSFLHLIGDVLPALAERGAAPARLLVENVAGFEVRSHSSL
jgi:hypothetical protein